MRIQPTHRTSQRGLTLIEALLAMALSTIIAVSMMALFSQSIKSRHQVDQDGQRIEAGRYTLDTLAEDLRLAGFYGDYMPRGSNGASWPDVDTASPANFVWQVPDPCATNLNTQGWYNGSNISASAPATLPTPDTQAWTPVAVYGYQAPTAASLPCLTNLLVGTDVIAVHRASTVSYAWNAPTAGQWNAVNASSGAAVQVGDYYVQASNCNTDLQRFTFNTLGSAVSNAGFTTVRTMACGAANPQIRRYIKRVYFVASCNECLPTPDGIPTLKVAELSGGAMVIRSVTPGVENLHFEYGVDTGGDGSADSYVDSIAAPTATTPFAWQNVMSVKVFVLARDLLATNQYNNTTSYAMGSRTVTAADSFRRSVFSSTVRLNNPAGARESP